MKKKFELYCSSFKASACTKPTALLMFILLIVVVTIATGMCTRQVFSGVEYEIFKGPLIIRENKQNPVDFSDYKAIGKKLATINHKGLCDEAEYKNEIAISCYYPQIINPQGQSLELDFEQFCFEVAPFLFTQAEIDAGAQVMYCGKKFFREHDLKNGDKIIFEGSEFTLRENHKAYNTNATPTIPYTANIRDYAYERFPESDEDGNYISANRFFNGRTLITGKQNIPTSYEKDILASIGLTIESPGIVTYFITPMIMLAVILLGAVASILTVYNYIIKINGRRYAIYKIIGVPPLTVSGIMFAESLALTSIGVGLGIAIEMLFHFLCPMDGFLIDRLLWMHCVSLLAVPLITTLTIVGVKIIAHAKAVPVAVKYLQ